MNSAAWMTAGLGLVTFVAGPVAAETVSLEPIKDNSLIEDVNGGVSSGAGPYLFAGRTSFAGVRRAVLAFDVAGGIPAGSTINSATLTLFLSKTPSNPQTVDLTVHRLVEDWGEGTSSANGGNGAPSTPGDATWAHTFFSDQFWTTPGGDYVSTASATAPVPSTNLILITWGPTAQMTADVQQWLDDPGQSFGWIIIGNESLQQTARRFDSREGLTPPVLQIEYTPPAGSCPTDIDGDGDTDVDDLTAVILDWGTDGSEHGGDVDGSGLVDVDDLTLVILAWGPCE